jgi:hypothetical protein
MKITLFIFILNLIGVMLFPYLIGLNIKNNPKVFYIVSFFINLLAVIGYLIDNLEV